MRVHVHVMLVVAIGRYGVVVVQFLIQSSKKVTNGSIACVPRTTGVHGPSLFRYSRTCINPFSVLVSSGKGMFEMVYWSFVPEVDYL